MLLTFQARQFLLLPFILMLFLPVSLKAQKKALREKDYPEHYQLVFPKLIPYRQGDLWGYADSTGAVKIKPQYTSAAPFENDHATVSKDGAMNLIDISGKELLNWEHRYLYVWNNRLVVAETQERIKGLYTITGDAVLPTVYREITFLKRSNTPARDLVVGWIEERQLRTPGSYSNSGPVHVFGLYTEEGNTVLPLIYHGINYLGAGVIETLKDRTYAYYNEQGNLLPAFQGYRVGPFRNGLASISRDNLYGFADSTGRIVVPLLYQDAKNFSEGRAAVKLNGKWGFIDTSGRELTPFKYLDPQFFQNGFAIVQTGKDGYGLIDREGKEATPQTYSYIYAARPGQIYALNTNGKIDYGIREKGSGNIIIPEGLADVKFFSEGWAVATKNGKKGYIDENGKEVIPFVYTEAMRLVHGLAAVHNGTAWGVVNKANQVVIPFKFDGVEVINPDRFVVWMFNRPGWGLKALMNARGQEITPLKYTYISGLENDRLAVMMGENKWGLIDLSGRELVKPLPLPEGYTVSGSFKNGIRQVINKEKNKLGYVDWKGRFYFRDQL